MCTRTDVRYPRQPLDVCDAFQAMQTIMLELEFDQGVTLNFVFNIKAHLLAPLSDKSAGKSLEYQQKQRVRQSEWLPCPRLNSEQTMTSFERRGTESSAFFCFEVEHSLPRVQLCPPGSLFVNHDFQIEWTSSAQRVPTLAILVCDQETKLISEFEQALFSASKMTFIQRNSYR